MYFCLGIYLHRVVVAQKVESQSQSEFWHSACRNVFLLYALLVHGVVASRGDYERRVYVFVGVLEKERRRFVNISRRNRNPYGSSRRLIRHRIFAFVFRNARYYHS